MIVRSFIIILFVTIVATRSAGQCSSYILSYPYTESFETSNGGWYSGGVLPDWQWGTPSKPVINSAGSGNKCWVVGGLTGSKYNDGEASWLQAAPCFSFTNIEHPYVSFKVFWEMEHRFDGAAFQYSIDGGSVWHDVGGANDPQDCLNTNWFNFSNVTYLQATPFLNSSGSGWSGNIQNTAGSCQGGNGSNGWAVASHLMPYLAGKGSVKFRFTFASGTICNNFDGFAIDDIYIGEAPPNNANFTFSCIDQKTVQFNNTSSLCPTSFKWDFSDPASGSSNNSSLPDVMHSFSAPGTYNVSLTVDGPNNRSSTIVQPVTVLQIGISSITPAACETNTGGKATINVTGNGGPYSYLWNTAPPQTTATASDLSEGVYSINVTAPGACPVDTSITISISLDCSDIFFPTAFSPNGDGKNDLFGPLGGLAAISNYRLQVYNRWGKCVFNSVNPFEKWDGSSGGKRNNNNIFVWFASYQQAGLGRIVRKGTIVLIK